MIRLHHTIGDELDSDAASMAMTQEEEFAICDLRFAISQPLLHPCRILIRRPRFLRLGLVSKSRKIRREDPDIRILQSFPELREGFR